MAKTGVTDKFSIGCGKMYVTVNKDEANKISEVFTHLGRDGGCKPQSEATARLIHLALKHGASVEEVVDELRGIRCTACISGGEVKVLSCPDAIARMLEECSRMEVTPIRISKNTPTL